MGSFMFRPRIADTTFNSTRAFTPIWDLSVTVKTGDISGGRLATLAHWAAGGELLVNKHQEGVEVSSSTLTSITLNHFTITPRAVNTNSR